MNKFIIIKNGKSNKPLYLKDYHVGMSDQPSESEWTEDIKLAIVISGKVTAESISDRFPGSYIQAHESI